MPVVQPQNWPYNPWVFNKAEELWNKLPSDVRNNLKFMADAPTPGFPIGAADDLIAGGIKGAVAIPALLRNKKTKDVLTKVLQGLDLSQEVPLIRNQQQNVPFPVSLDSKGRVPRNALFGSPLRHRFQYDEMELGNAEGGPYQVEWLQKLKNPLVIRRDQTGFLGDQVISKLLGQSTTAEKVAPKYLSPKQIQAAVEARDPKNAISESVASELARRAGYDSIVSARPGKGKLNPTQVMLIEKELLKNMQKQYKDFVNPPRRDLSTFGKTIVDFFKSGYMQPNALPDVIKFNLEQGHISPEEIQLIQQAIQ